MQTENALLHQRSGADSHVRATTATSTPRVDLYRLAHKGLRACFANTLVEVGRMDVNDDEYVNEVCAQVRYVLTLCHSHLEKEERFIHPALERRRPGSTWLTAQDHVQHERQCARLENYVNDLLRYDNVRRGVAAARLYEDLALFVAENLIHMRAEEKDNNALLWESHSDVELAAIHDAIVGSIAPHDMLMFLRWMVPAVSPMERAQLFAGMRRSAPAAAVAAALAVVEPHLSAQEWERLQTDLACV